MNTVEPTDNVIEVHRTVRRPQTCFSWHWWEWDHVVLQLKYSIFYYCYESFTGSKCRSASSSGCVCWCTSVSTARTRGGSKCRRASSSGCVCWCTSVSTAWHWATLLRPSVQFLVVPRDTVSDLPTRQRYWSPRHTARHWRPCVSCSGSQSPEFSTWSCQGRNFTARFPSRT